MKGRKPIPLAIRELRGSKSHKKANPSPPEPAGTIGDPPAWMRKAEAELWREVAADLPAGLLRACDRPAFGVYISTLTTWRGYHALEGKGDPKEVLSVHRLMLNLAATLIRLESEFGITPASRSRVRVEVPKGESEFEQFRKRSKMG
jgi:phage terminase small subunit